MVVKVLVVDDSALMRKHLRMLLVEEGYDVQIARTGREALDELVRFEPDVITLDINMPEMDGLTTLAHIMTNRPTPTVMVSSLTEKGALATLEALALGAVDYIAKPGGTVSLSIESIAESLANKVRVAATARVRPKSAARTTPRAAAPATPQPPQRVYSPSGSPFGLVLIGVSTGGPRALEEVLPKLPKNLAWPVLVAQHMPAAFTASLAHRLNGLCALEVTEGAAVEELQPGRIYIARGGADMAVSARNGRLVLVHRPESPNYTWHPSVDVLVSTALEHVPPANLVGVQMTGMGHDGADSMARLKAAGGRTIAESQETAVVFGMPAELIRRNGASCVLPYDKIAAQIRQWVGTIPTQQPNWSASRASAS
jgi:two-component system chemotaxis response regulator CheB